MHVNEPLRPTAGGTLGYKGLGELDFGSLVIEVSQAKKGRGHFFILWGYTFYL
jgi:hypothetical protein